MQRSYHYHPFLFLFKYETDTSRFHVAVRLF